MMIFHSKFKLRGKTPKYRNIKTVNKNGVFDSKGESIRYNTLLELQTNGNISCLERQKKIVLIDSFIYQGRKQRSISYIADYYYYDISNAIWIIEDYKSVVTIKDSVYRIKKKLLYRYLSDKPNTKLIECIGGKIKEYNTRKKAIKI